MGCYEYPSTAGNYFMLARLSGPMEPNECQAPNCSKDGSNAYHGENGNRIRLCDRHYYNHVTNSTGFGADLSPYNPMDITTTISTKSTDIEW